MPWKGYLKLSLVSCPIALSPATSDSERVSFNQINRETGNRVRQRKVDETTGEEVRSDQIVKGYKVGKNEYLLVEREELEGLQVESTRIIDIDSFVPREQIDLRYFDSPYYIAPDGKVGQDAFAIIRDAMTKKGVVGIGRVVLSSRERPIMLEPFGKGLRAMTLRYSYEVRSEAEYFAEIAEMQSPDDLLQLAGTIIDGKVGEFKPEGFVDRYEEAVVELLNSKKAGKPLVQKAVSTPANILDLAAALRASVAARKHRPDTGEKYAGPNEQEQMMARLSPAPKKKTRSKAA